MDKELMQEFVDKVDFIQTSVSEEIPQLIKEIDKIKNVNLDEEYFNNLKSELNERRKTLFEMLDEEIRLFKNAKKDLDESKTFLLNVLKEIKKENESLRKDMKKSLSSFNKFTYLVAFAAAAALGYYAGLHHLFIFH